MNRFPNKVTNLHADDLHLTQLGQLCGSKQLFRDRYEVLRVIGRGGFGVTFLAKNAILPGNPLCVIKQLCPKTTNPKSWERARVRFEKEATILGQLGSHSQIPMLVDYFEMNGEFYLVQEYVRGCTVAREVRRHGVRSEAAVKQFLREILPVLQYVHNHRVIHRDIKPHNILRCEEDGRLVLIDFGAVKEELVQAFEGDGQKTASTNFVGTMGFAPPEQFALRPVYGSDIYALGVTCLYLLTGKAPLDFEYEATTGEIAWQNDVDVSEHFGLVLNKMIKMSLKDRFKSTQDVMWALGMESYLPGLSNCLATTKLKGENSSGSSEGGNKEHHSPFVRTADQIRALRAKLHAKKQERKYNSLLHSGSLG
jgi:serine/threonine protein kinase